MVGITFARHAIARVGGDRNHDLNVRHAAFDFFDQPRCRLDLPHRYAVDPDSRALTLTWQSSTETRRDVANISPPPRARLGVTHHARGRVDGQCARKSNVNRVHAPVQHACRHRAVTFAKPTETARGCHRLGLQPTSTRPPHGTSCTSCRNRTDTGHCAQPWACRVEWVLVPRPG